MDDELYQKLRCIASRDSRSFNQEAVLILRRYVAAYESEHGEITPPVPEPSAPERR